MSALCTQGPVPPAHSTWAVDPVEARLSPAPWGQLGTSQGGRTRGPRERSTRDGAQGPSAHACHPDEDAGPDAGSLGTSRPLLLSSSEPLTLHWLLPSGSVTPVPTCPVSVEDWSCEGAP